MKNLTFLLFFCAINSFSQVGINTVMPDPSAILDVTSSNKGMLVPRISLLSTTDVNTIALPLISLLIYNTNTVADITPGYYYWNGLEWSKLATSKMVGDTWSFLGNSRTDETVNFIGTTDDEDLVFKRNNIKAGVLDTKNTAFGVNSLYSNTTGFNNSANGVSALYSNTTGVNNTASGKNSLYNNTTGSNNIAMGVSALLTNTTGNNNTASGTLALRSNTEGTDNTASGQGSLYSNTEGDYNSGFGRNSIRLNTIGNYNTGIGYEALVNVTTGCNNTAIGYNATVPDGTLDNQVQIGNSAVTHAEVQVAWTITSDKRWKNTIEDSDLGLDFINKLHPVSYFRNNDKNNKLEYGFIAQELKEVLKNSSVKTNGIITEDTKGMLSVRYNDLLSPMVKAIQEQTKEIKQLKLKQQAMEKELKEIKSLLLNKN